MVCVTRGEAQFRRAGFALPLTLLCVIVVSLSLCALLALAIMDVRGTAAQLGVAHAQGEAEYHAAEGIAAWTAPTLAAVPIGSVLTPAPGNRTVRRLSGGLFLFSGVGTASPGVHRTIRLVLGLEPPGLAVQRAFTTPGAVRLTSGAVVLEAAAGPGACDLSDSTEAGWIVQPDYQGPVEDPVPWAARAEIHLAGGTVVQPGPQVLSGSCQSTDPTNWGDPGGVGACRSHRPVVWVNGDLTVTGGAGQGILVVDGDLTARGGFQYDGLVLIGGRLEISGAGARFRGGVQTGDAGSIGSDIGSGGRISYSTCSLTRVTRRFGSLRLISGGRWLGDY